MTQKEVTPKIDVTRSPADLWRSFSSLECMESYGKWEAGNRYDRGGMHSRNSRVALTVIVRVIACVIAEFHQISPILMAFSAVFIRQNPTIFP